MFSSAAVTHAPVLSASRRCRSSQTRKSAVTLAASKPEPPRINNRGFVAEDNSGRCAVCPLACLRARL